MRRQSKESDTFSCPERDARLDAVALARLPGVGPVAYRESLQKFGTARRALLALANAPAQRKALAAAEAALAEASHCGSSLLVQGSDEYPAALFDLPDPPPYLYAAGNSGALAVPAVAIVGTRRATPYGERVTRELAAALARGGVAVISGLARGIDATAHRAALAEGGLTIAVLGTGIDIAYPAIHRALRKDIATHGLLLSEERPGDRASAGSFPKRNRVIAALATVTIVVEAGSRSGALITAGHALDLGRTVAAVPGPIDSPQSAGTNELIRDGATVIATVADALALFGLSVSPTRTPPLTTPAERAVWHELENGALDLDSLATATALRAQDCLAAVTTLELAGAVHCDITGVVRRSGAPRS